MKPEHEPASKIRRGEQPQRSEQATLASEAAEKAAKQLLNEAEWHEDNVISISGEIEPFIDEALRKQQLPLIEGYIRMFVEAILHGSDEHRIWLKEAGECFVNGRPMPERPCPFLVPPAAVATSEQIDKSIHPHFRSDPATSEPQEQDLKLLAIDCCQIVHGSSTNAEAAASIYERISAAIAAERECRKQAEQLRDDVLLREVKLIRQLLAAQAAIARHIAEHDECEDFDFAKFDLSLLREHDAEVRKPLATANLRLVKALERIAEGEHPEEAPEVAAAALAQAKEQP